MEENRFIAEFMGWKEFNEFRAINPIDSDDCWDYEDMRFHSDWNWLMEVVKKIKQIGKEELKFSIDFELAILTTNKETIYNACLEFIKWYNE